MNPIEATARSEPGEVITFYSYKGGAGRSMLLANCAWQLASAGRRVLLIDWDLEAPGLHRYFKPFLGNDPELRQQVGVMEWVTDYWEAKMDQPQSDVETLVRNHADPRHYVTKLETTGFISDGGIDLMCAGRQDKSYAGAVADFSWPTLYRKYGGKEFMAAAKRILVGSDGYDYVLIDSRTGVSETSGFCTVALADTLVICFTYNNQSVIGASNIARDIKQQVEQRRSLEKVGTGEERRFRLFAVPTRYDDAEQERLESRQKHAWKQFEDLLTDIPRDQQANYWLNVQVKNQALFSYEEVLAACVNRPGDPQTVLASVTQLTRALTNDAFSDPVALTDGQRLALREQFGLLGDNTPAATTHDAWALFTQRFPQDAAREALLHTCFPLLVQLFTIAPPSTSQSEPNLIRTMVLEGELTIEEQRMAEMLTASNLTQRRITNDQKRAIAVADDSLLANWALLQERLVAQMPFITAREQLRAARRTWEKNGRSIAALFSLQSDFLTFDLTDEQRAWIGRPDAQLLQAIREVRALQENERVMKVQLAKLGDESNARISDLISSNATMEKQHGLLQSTLLDQTEELRSETRRATRLRTSLVATTIAITVLFTTSLVQYYQLSGSRAQLALAMASEIESRSAKSALQKELDGEKANGFYVQGMSLLNQAVPGLSRKERFSNAIAAFSQAIQLSPTHAESYRGRALARHKLVPEDSQGELSDWALYYDLVPSLAKRSDLVVSAAQAKGVDPAFLESQLDRLLEEAESPNPDSSPPAVAAKLRKVDFPVATQAKAKSVIEALSKLEASYGSSR